MRTSVDSPLGISFCSFDSDSGLVGITLCPGKIQANSMSGGWHRDLALDVESLVKSNISTIVSLITSKEMTELRVESLGEEIKQHGIEWIHLPLKDRTVPDDDWISSYLEILPRLIEKIRRGERVVFHCKGGLGRSGTAVAMLIHYRGHSMEHAVRWVRRIRGEDAIESIQVEFLFEWEKDRSNSKIQLEHLEVRTHLVQWDTIEHAMWHLHQRVAQDEIALPAHVYKNLVELPLMGKVTEQAERLLASKYWQSLGDHMLWAEAYLANKRMLNIESLVWILIFQHLAHVYEVPMSWIATLRLSRDEYGSWMVGNMQNFYEVDGCNDSVWAAHLDGVRAGIIPPDSFPFKRKLENIEACDTLRNRWE
ncbi:MAG: protein-tyrosine phosphatase [Candidatus Poseidoniaceae archaeon]|jgi:protein-tyrosine phosphatase